MGVHTHTLYRYFKLERSPNAEHVAAIVDMTDADARQILTGQPSKKPRHDDYQAMFAAALEAKRAYEAFEAAYQSGTPLNKIDLDLHRALYRAGQRLNDLGGIDAMTAAYYAWYEGDDDRRYKAGNILNRAWSGIGDWLA